MVILGDFFWVLGLGFAAGSEFSHLLVGPGLG
jgi:hypothetical protein